MARHLPHQFAQPLQEQGFPGEFVPQASHGLDLAHDRRCEDIRPAIDLAALQIAEGASMADFGLSKASR